jgi:hypothetical protein
MATIINPKRIKKWINPAGPPNSRFGTKYLHTHFMFISFERRYVFDV